MAKCAHCGKTPQFGHSRSHSMQATKRKFKVNLQTTTVYDHGHIKKVKLCGKCLKALAKTG